MRITDFPELVTATGNDLLVTVDIANDLTKKIKLENLPISIATTVALATKQNLLVSGTNIKTINSTSLLGSGDITIAANPSGVAGAIQFSNGSAFASDAANLFWDDTNNRLGIRTNSPTATTHIVGVDQLTTSTSLLVQDSVGGNILRVHNSANNSAVVMSTAKIADYEIISGNVLANTQMRFVPTTGGIAVNKDYSFAASNTLVHLKGSGSTSATTSLLVQNSAGTAALTVKDDLNVFLGSSTTGSGSNTLDQYTQRLYINGGSQISHYITGTANGSGDTSLAICGLGTGGGYVGGIRMFTSSNSATPVLAMIVDRNQSVGIGLTNSTDLSVNASAKLQVDSTTRGFLPPRMTTTQKNAIASPLAGLQVYDTTTNKLCCFNGSTWNDLF